MKSILPCEDDKEVMDLIPLCEVKITLEPTINIGEAAHGNRIIAEIKTMDFTGERLNASLKGRAAADWLTIQSGVAIIDVRATIETHDGAFIYVQYKGRTSTINGLGSEPIVVAPTFETADPRYQWLNPIQGIGKGKLSTMSYQWFEVR